MVKPVILPIFCVEFLSEQNANPRERDYPELHLASVGVSKRLKLAVDGPWREIVVDKTTVTGCVLVGVNVPFFRNERSQIG